MTPGISWTEIRDPQEIGKLVGKIIPQERYSPSFRLMKSADFKAKSVPPSEKAALYLVLTGRFELNCAVYQRPSFSAVFPQNSKNDLSKEEAAESFISPFKAFIEMGLTFDELVAAMENLPLDVSERAQAKNFAAYNYKLRREVPMRTINAFLKTGENFDSQITEPVKFFERDLEHRY